jgi:glycerophosphoryl diester phosphodiesterase
VHHDDTLERTTNGVGPVAALTAVELARLDAAWHFSTGNGFPFRGQGIGVPALRDVLVRYPSARVIIEMKVDTRELGHAVAREVQQAGAIDRVCAAGYGSQCLGAVREALPGLATSASHREVRLAYYRSRLGWPVGGGPYGGYQVPETSGRHRVVSPRFIRHAHGAGLKVQVWTVDDPDDMTRLLSWGVDALISNRPDVAIAVRNDALRRG